MSIVLVSVGRIYKEVIEALKDNLSRVFNKEIFIGKEMPKPYYAFNKKRNQYLSTAILNTLKEQKEYTPYKMILGIVDHDLYVPELNFVFGEADISGATAIISLTRLREEFYGISPNKSIFHMRAIKEAIHEIGHLYGLSHCHNPRCIMYFSNSIRDTDTKGPDFCNACKSRFEIPLRF